MLHCASSFTSRFRLCCISKEKEILEKQKELIEAKTQNLQSAKRVEELYTNALNAMRHYSGAGGDEDEC